jgi:hypothetical protein
MPSYLCHYWVFSFFCFNFICTIYEFESQSLRGVLDRALCDKLINKNNWGISVWYMNSCKRQTCNRQFQKKSNNKWFTGKQCNFYYFDLIDKLNSHYNTASHGVVSVKICHVTKCYFPLVFYLVEVRFFFFCPRCWDCQGITEQY